MLLQYHCDGRDGSGICATNQALTVRYGMLLRSDAGHIPDWIKVVQPDVPPRDVRRRQEEAGLNGKQEVYRPCTIAQATS